MNLERWGAAYVAMPGHKGLYGPQGTGLLLCGAGQEPSSLLEGGTGSLSRQQEMPAFLPDRLEDAKLSKTICKKIKCSDRTLSAGLGRHGFPL